jgi:hypothetical protein
MKKIFDRHKIHEYWQNMYHSVHRKISRGAEFIRNMVPWGKGGHGTRDKNHKKSQ